LLLFSVLPSWFISAALSLPFKPSRNVVAHLVLLALLGWILAEISLIGFYKVPFTCSYLPGKSNIQLVFWAFFLVCLPLAASIASIEHDVRNHPFKLANMAFLFGAVAYGLFVFNRSRARSAILYFEELPEEVITTLGLSV